MKLSTKMLGIPATVMVVVFIIMGMLISILISSNAKIVKKNELTHLLQGIEKQFRMGLSIITTSNLPSTTILALEGNDDTLAKDLVKQVKSMGLDATFITDLAGKVLYPKEMNLPNGLSAVLEKAPRASGAIQVLPLDKQMVGYAPIVDVETPKGFLVFVVNIPQGILDLLQTNARDKTSFSEAKEVATETKASVYLENSQKESQAQAEVFQQKMLFGTGAIMVVGLLAIVIALSSLTRSITKPLNHIIKGLTEGADKVASASSQVSAASQSLAEGASEQAASLEETSASVEEMASMTRQNADNAGQANSMMAETSTVVDRANSSMIELTGAMGEISGASEETAKIIKTIDEIAFQTNLLALNAAVEAARAGEAGAGFAVVAEEVRNLAMRSAEAAKNTANLIEGTVKKIKVGSDIVSKTNEAFSRVAQGARKAGELVGEISAASHEQAQGVEQINRAIEEMGKVVQKNATGAGESASASEEMTVQAEQMKCYVADLVKVVGGNGHGAAVAVPPAMGYGQGGARLFGSVRPSLPLPIKKARGKGMAKGGQGSLKITRPDQVLPLEEGEFRDF